MKIMIKREIWDLAVDTARQTKEKGERIRAFFLYSERGNPLKVVRAKEVPVRIIKETSPSGPIFRWGYSKDEYRKYYPKGGSDRYSGTILIKQDLSMTLHYSYFMGIDFPGGSGGFNINLWIADDGRPVYRSFYVNRERTDGEFIEIPMETY